MTIENTPHNDEAERILLATCLYDRSLADEITDIHPSSGGWKAMQRDDFQLIMNSDGLKTVIIRYNSPLRDWDQMIERATLAYGLSGCQVVRFVCLPRNGSMADAAER